MPYVRARTHYTSLLPKSFVLWHSTTAICARIQQKLFSCSPTDAPRPLQSAQQHLPLSPAPAPTPASSPPSFSLPLSLTASLCKFQLHKPHPKLKYAATACLPLFPAFVLPPTATGSLATLLWWRQLCLAIWLSGSRQAAYPIDWHWPRGSFFFLPNSQKAFRH